jgi:hypothetical protein
LLAVAARLAAVWRSVWTPKAAREIEDAGLQHALAGMPEPPPASDPWAGLDEAQRRAGALERRSRELARLYDRRREEPPEP